MAGQKFVRVHGRVVPIKAKQDAGKPAPTAKPKKVSKIAKPKAEAFVSPKDKNLKGLYGAFKAALGVKT